MSFLEVCSMIIGEMKSHPMSRDLDKPDTPGC